MVVEDQVKEQEKKNSILLLPGFEKHVKPLSLSFS